MKQVVAFFYQTKNKLYIFIQTERMFHGLIYNLLRTLLGPLYMMLKVGMCCLLPFGCFVNVQCSISELHLLIILVPGFCRELLVIYRTYVKNNHSCIL